MWNTSDALSRNAVQKAQVRQDRPLQQHPRTLLSVPLTLQYLAAHGVRTTHGISLDISEGGIGALLQHTLGVGETVGIEFELEGRPLSTVAIVRYSSNLRSGFEFVGLTVEERALFAGITAHA